MLNKTRVFTFCVIGLGLMITGCDGADLSGIDFSASKVDFIDIEGFLQTITDIFKIQMP